MGNLTWMEVLKRFRRRLLENCMVVEEVEGSKKFGVWRTAEEFDERLL